MLRVLGLRLWGFRGYGGPKGLGFGAGVLVRRISAFASRCEGHPKAPNPHIPKHTDESGDEREL